MSFYTKTPYFLIFLFLTELSTAGPLDISNIPLYLGGSVKPNIMVMLDNSGSMKIPMYEDSSWRGSVRSGFDPTIEYSGIFDATKSYQYDTSILVNSAAYSITVDTSKTGAFHEAACTPAIAENTCWSGRYLNWLSARRIDASRTVLIGGKLESRAPFSYGSGYQYKIVANNEYADYDFGGKLSNSDSYSPVANNRTVMVTSPAHQNGGAVKSSYDPYAKLNVGGAVPIFNSANTKIGEFGQADILAAVDGSKYLTAASWTLVNLSQTYTNPIIIAKAPSLNGGDPGVVRIKSVTSTSFQISFQEWFYRDGNHTTEQVSYFVVEAGDYTLPGGQKLIAGSTSTDKEYAEHGSCSADTTASELITFSSAFSSTPIVLTSTTTYSNQEAINVRTRDINTTGFRVALQQEEATTTAPTFSENIDYIAITAGNLTDATNNWKLEAKSLTNVDEDTSTNNNSFNFTAGFFSSSPAFVADMTSINDSDPAALRLKSIDKDGAAVQVEEETSCDSEINHSNESAGYIALEGESATYNLALVTTTEPIGLLQEIKDDVRLGTSFYRYPPDKTDIYNGVTTQGGTLRFNIPNNPFVKNPSASGGYRQLDGYISEPGTNINDIVDSLEHYPLVWGTTPLAENLWEVIQYFEQDDPYYTPVMLSGVSFENFTKANVSVPERDPYYYASEGEKLWCAKSSVIIFTDGEPYRDADIPVAIRDYDDDSDSNDKIDNSNAATLEGKDNLDDVAYWAYCNTASGTCFDDPASSTRKAVTPSRDLRTDLTGDASDKGQSLRIHTVGFAGGAIRPILQDTADNAGGYAYAAQDGKALKTALTQAFSAAASVSSAASAELNSGSISGSSKLYQARFDSSTWSGELLAFPINSDGSLDPVLWNAGDNIPAAGSRKIITHDGSTGIPFQWTDISITQKALLANDSEVLDFIRGDQTKEVSQGTGATFRFRDRTTLLGDIVNSPPSFLGPPNAIYPDNWGSGAAENAVLYSAFKTSSSGRLPMVYVGANDGMYHAFDASSGVEKFAYIPNAVFKRLNNLSDPNFTHQYLVDGQSTILDAFFGGAWHTVAVSTLGGGGQGVFALDVTNPGDFGSESTAATKVLWEFTEGTNDDVVGSTNDRDIGYTFGQASIVRLSDGRWAAIFSGGYNNTDDDDVIADTTNDSLTGNAVLYVVDISNGSLIHKFDTEVGITEDPSGNNRPNGLSTPSIIDINGDFIADYIYVGDLLGNVWKMDITGLESTWGFSYNSGGKPQALFTACHGTICGAGNIQPITSQIQVVKHPQSVGYLLYFGTGKYLEVGDNSDTGEVTQTFYSVWDKAGSTLTPFNRSQLLQQSITHEVSQDSFDLRVTTESNINWNLHQGWYIDLVNTEGSNTNNYGERMISNAIVRNGRIIFTTLIPLDDPCDSGGTGWLMEMDLFSGNRLTYSPFDIDGDGKFSEADFYHFDTNNDGIIDPGEIVVPVSGKKSKVGIIPKPSIITSPDGETEYKYTPGSTGEIEITTENPGVNVYGRQSWRQIYSE